MNTSLYRNLFILLFFFSLQTITIAQRAPLDIALQHIDANKTAWKLSKEDIQDLRVSDLYTTKSTQVTHVYLNQRYKGIDILRGLINVTIDKNGKAYNVGHRFIADLNQKINATEPFLSPSQALQNAAFHVGLKNIALPRILDQKGINETIFDKGSISEENIKVQLCYFLTENGQLRLAYNLAIRLLTSSDFPSLRIDALTGEVLEKNNWTHSCTFHENAYQRLDLTASCTHEEEDHIVTSNTSDAGQYRVYKFPTESPSFSIRELVSDPHDLTASPFGWHDVNGSNGAEFTFTRGNNVHAYQDEDGNNLDEDDEPDGGASLNFDFPLSFSIPPSDFQDAAVTNLFYVSNFMHDFAYVYGFDEPAGNFQQNNYENGGFDDDYVRAEAQDGDGVNNAQFSAGPEGSKPRMEMFLWDRNPGGQRVLQVNSPASVAGIYIASLADFGPPISTTPITAQVVIVDDGVNEFLSTDACEENFVNGSDLDGKIALIDRGGCDYEQKTVNAENYGAIAVIICDFNPEPNFMNGIGSIPNPNIPSIRIGSSDCQKIRIEAENGLNVSLVLPAPTGPSLLDGDFDNGIIVHEYSHGISERLTGGPNTTLCLNNDEQMGEGWSDFFSLATTAKQSDNGAMRRGLATYLYRQETNGNGVRSYPYSTDMNINPLSYRDIGNERIPHGLGAVWCSMLWDLYWDLTEEYGWSADLLNGTKGNNIAIQLVMDGMKLQPCKPGFVDARDAILLADQMRYDGANQCLISKTFARRGLGHDADQGDNNGLDAFEDFQEQPLCLEELKIEKSAVKIISAGSNYNIILKVFNHNPQTMTNVVVTDDLQLGMTFTGNSTIPATLNGNTLSFDLGTMEYLDTIEFFYQVATSPNRYSVRQHFYDAETENNWDSKPLLPTNNPALFWQLSTQQKNSGSSSWYVNNTSAEAKQQLILKDPILITGDKPALRFYHTYKTEGGVDGGTVEISTAPNLEGAVFEQLSDKAIRNGYPGFIQYTTFIIPNLQAYSGTQGQSNNFVDSYFDLSDYKGQEVYLRFNFATSVNGAPPGGGYWFVDDIEIMDLHRYSPEACVTADQANTACVRIPGGGTVVESQISTPTTDLTNTDINIELYPNPALDQLNLTIHSNEIQDLQINLVSVEGKAILQKSITTTNRVESLSLDVTKVPAGIYLVKIHSEEKVLVRKVVIQ